MKDLEKTKRVLLGLSKHSAFDCKGCPYAGFNECSTILVEDAIDVIVAQKELLNRKPKAPCDYIVLHPDDGGRALLVRKDKIIYAYDGKSGDATNIRLSGDGGFDCLLLVKETANDILKLLEGEEE